MLMETGPALADRLRERVVRPDALTPACRDAMFALFADYYANVGMAAFTADLDGKDMVILLETDGGIVGFTTVAVGSFRFAGSDVTVVFSGDTIVDRAYWGEQVLARAWLREMGRLSRLNGDREMVWFLIVKGHRTYRYLPAFARRYVPSREPCGNGDLLALRDALARDRFGDAFEPGTGIIHFASPRGNLLPAWSEPTPRELRRPDVRFFIESNPGYRSGDELACLCPISRDNMKPLAQRWFDAGYQLA